MICLESLLHAPHSYVLASRSSLRNSRVTSSHSREERIVELQIINGLCIIASVEMRGNRPTLTDKTRSFLFESNLEYSGNQQYNSLEWNKMKRPARDKKLRIACKDDFDGEISLTWDNRIVLSDATLVSEACRIQRHLEKPRAVSRRFWRIK